ncbi:MAG: hypothetical protein KatS3mg031_1435 [Chitinophagales bacterium]|nr:MAG: hypothetical protein KatS3mg031_1435 [Chitinophagales bacterium]
MIKIGVSSSFFYPDPERKVFGPKTLCYIEKDMANFLTRPGVIPVLIPDLPADSMKDFLDHMDGFVFQGGTDLAPQTYGEQPIGPWTGDKYRDEYEMAILDYAIRHHKPVLGICRGLQLINVYFGGTLYQDIKTQRPDALVHRDAVQYDQLSHDIAFLKGTLLDRLYHEETEKVVNSAHHQAVKDLGKDLEVMAISPLDQIIESFMWKGAEEGRVMAIQWHPEFFYNYKRGRLIDGDKVYEKFLSFCRGDEP